MEPKFRILLLEAAGCQAELVEYELSKTGGCCALARGEDLEDYLQALHGFGPNLILADCRLPHAAGLMALAQAQEVCPEVPFLFVSADLSPAPLKTRIAADYLQRRPERWL
jgi:CheY-like chemotaxis protein